MGIPLETSEQYNLAGGMNEHDADTNLLDSEWSYLRNVSFDRGVPTTRLGYAPLNRTAFNSGAQFLLDFYYSLDNGISDRLIASGDRLSRWNNGTEAVIAAGFNATQYWSAFQLANRVICGNGIDANRSWNGTVLSTLSIASPPQDNLGTFTATVNAGGTLPVGSYRYLYTYRNSVTLEESNPVQRLIAGVNVPLYEDAVTIAGNQSVTLSNFIASLDPNVDQIVIYRSTVDSVAPLDGPLFEIGTKANAVGNFEDPGIIDGSFEVTYDNNPAPNTGIMTGFLGRGYYAVGDTLHFSKPYIPGSVPAKNEFKIGRDGQPITCLLSIGNDALVIGKNRSIWILPGDPVINGATPQLFNRAHGVINNRSASVLDDYVYFIDQSLRPHRIIPTELANKERRVEYLGERMDSTFPSISKSGKESIKVTTIDIEEKKMWVVAAPLKSTVYADTLIIIDYDIGGEREAGGWTVWDEMGVATLTIAPDGEGIPRLYRGDYYGYMWRHFITYGDGAQINGTSTGGGTANQLWDTTQPLVDRGTTALGTVLTLIDAAFTGVSADQYKGRQIYIKAAPAGVNVGEYRKILSHTATPVTFTVDAPYPFAVVANSDYQIGGYEKDSLLGVPVLITGGTGKGQVRFVKSQYPDHVILYTNWNTLPTNTSTYAFGGINFQAWTNWKKLTVHDVVKRLWFLWFNFSKIGNYPITIALQFDFNTALTDTTYLTLTVQQLNTLWGFFLWGFGIWGARSSFQDKMGFDKYFHHIRIGILNSNAAQPIQFNGVTLNYQSKGLFTK